MTVETAAAVRAAPRSAVSRSRLALAAILLVALGARWAYAFNTPPGAQLASVDALGYHALALNLLDGHGFTLSGQPPYVPDAIRTPLYPALVAVIYALGGRNPLHVALAQGLLDTLTVLLLAATARRLPGRWRPALAAALLYALSPTAWRFCNEVLTEPLLATLLTGLLWAFVCFCRAGRWRWLALAGLLSGLAVLAKPNALLLPLILAAAALVRVWRMAPRQPPAWRARLAAALLPLALAGLVLFPWLFRNRLVFERWFLSHTFDNNLARVSAVATLARAQGERVAPWTPRWEALYSGLLLEAEARFGPNFTANPHTALEADRTQRQLAAVAGDVVRRYPADFALAHLGGFVRSWLPQEHRFWYEFISGRAWDSLGSVEGALGLAIERGRAAGPLAGLAYFWQARFGSLPPLALALWLAWLAAYALSAILLLRGTWRLRPRPALLLLVWASVLYITFLPGPIAHIRFRLPVAAMLLLVIGVGVVGREYGGRKLEVRS